VLNVDIDNLANEISRQLALYANAVEEDVDKAAQKGVKEGKNKLHQISPEGATGDYAKGWDTKKKGNNYILWNATDYQLTHLLENGHVNRDGSRTTPQPHIKPVEKQMIKDFEKEIRKAVEGN